MKDKNTPDIRILHEDNHLLVVEKPVNLLSQEDRTGDPDLLTLLKEDLKKRYDKPGNVFLGLVHRLDRPVGGVMVFAKTSKAAARLADQMSKKQFQKTYLAVLHGMPDEPSGRLKHYLIKDAKTNKTKAYDQARDGAKEVLLNYRVTHYVGALSLVRIELLTGRSHQIRAQFAAIGHPLYGDQKYGDRRPDTGDQIALWSHEIRLAHPTQSTPLVFTSRPPQTRPWTLFPIPS